MKMKNLKITNENYSATVIRVKNLVEVGLNTLAALPIAGMQALVPKTTQEGDLMILFPAETQLSHDFCYHNNLYRNSELNKNKETKGYIEDNRRVKAIKLGGQYSTALVMPSSSLSYLNIEVQEGDKFNEVNGTVVCEKYELKVPGESSRGNNVRGKNKKFKKVDAKLFPEHLDTENYLRNNHKIKDDETVVVTQKLHGSSGRFSNMLVNRELTWIERLLVKLGVNINTKQYEYVAGSRRTIKTADNEDANHFYDSDIWNYTLEKYKNVIPKNYIIYGEIVGYTPKGAEIQKGYAYEAPMGESDLYVYRIVVMNEDGVGVDLTHEQLKEFCSANGMNSVPELWRGSHAEWLKIHEKFKEVNYSQEYDEHYLVSGEELYNERPVYHPPTYPEEGVCVRVEGLTPYILKMKNQSFLVHESGELDKGVLDIETLN